MKYDEMKEKVQLDMLYSHKRENYTMRKMTEARRKSNAKYQSKRTRMYAVKLVDTTDADIIEKLDSVPNKQGYIKTAIREYMAKEK